MSKTFIYVEIGTNSPKHKIVTFTELQAYQILKRRVKKIGKDINNFELIGD